MLWWTLKRLTQRVFPASEEGEQQARLRLCEVVVAVRDDERGAVQAVWDEVDSSLPLRLATGGATRQDSVRAAVELCNGELVAVHDAARPLATAQLLENVARAALACGAAIPATPACDTVKQVTERDGQMVIEATLERSRVWMAQTPQVFKREILWAALQQAERENFAGTDCASLVERLQGVAVVPADPENFKVTYAVDLERAARALS